MPEETAAFEAMHLTKSRLEGLSDGIFAFSMTLLVIGINLPDKAAIVQSPAYAARTLFAIYPDFFHYVLAFLILGAFWLSHHVALHPVKSLDRAFVWLNLATLLFVALLPFSTSFAGDFPNVPLGAIVFEANLLVIGMGMVAQWRYATAGSRLVEQDLDPHFTRHVGHMTLIVPALSAAGILIALTGNLYSQSVYMLTPLVAYLIHHREREQDPPIR